MALIVTSHLNNFTISKVNIKVTIYQMLSFKTTQSHSCWFKNLCVGGHTKAAKPYPYD